MLVLSEDAARMVCLHAQAAYPEECCGMMEGMRYGEIRTVCRILPVRNRAEAGKRKAYFFIDPLDIVRAETAAGRAGHELVGFYHSHPDHGAGASARDEAHMLGEYSYLIVSVVHGKYAGMKSFEKPDWTASDAREEKILVKEIENADFSVCVGDTEDFCESEVEA